MKYLVMILFLIGFLGIQFADGLIMGHPLEYWDSADIILDGVVLEQFNETDGLVQHDVKVEQYFKNPKSQIMITVYGPGIYTEDFFYPKIFEKGQRALFYLKKMDDKYIILEQSIQATEKCDPRSMIGLSTLPGEPLARGGLTLFYDPYQTCNGYLTPPGFLRDSLSPLKQWQAGIKLGDIGCHNDLQLMFRHSEKPVCIKESSISRLLDYRWTLVEQGDLDLRTPLPTVTIAELPKQIDNETTLSFAIEVSDIKENHDRPTISITDENQKKVWSGQWLNSSNSGYLASSVDYSVQYYKEDFPEKIVLKPGSYMVSISIDKQTVSKKIVVVPKMLDTGSESKVSPQEFLLDLEDKGKFYLRYWLKGATLQSITKDSQMESLNVELADSKNDGYFEISIPRNLIDAKIGNSDDTFVVIADKYEVPYTEITNDFERTIHVEFNEGTKLIKIVATSPLFSEPKSQSTIQFKAKQLGIDNIMEATDSEELSYDEKLEYIKFQYGEDGPNTTPTLNLRIKDLTRNLEYGQLPTFTLIETGYANPCTAPKLEVYFIKEEIGYDLENDELIFEDTIVYSCPYFDKFYPVLNFWSEKDFPSFPVCDNEGRYLIVGDSGTERVALDEYYCNLK